MFTVKRCTPKDTERLRDIWTDAQTEDVGGEDDGAAGLGRAGDIGSEPPGKVADDLAGLAAGQRQVRRVAEALRVLGRSGRSSSSKHAGEAEKDLRGPHGAGTGSPNNRLLVAAAQLLCAGLFKRRDPMPAQCYTRSLGFEEHVS